MDPGARVQRKPRKGIVGERPTPEAPAKNGPLHTRTIFRDAMRTDPGTFGERSCDGTSSLTQSIEERQGTGCVACHLGGSEQLIELLLGGPEQRSSCRVISSETRWFRTSRTDEGHEAILMRSQITRAARVSCLRPCSVADGVADRPTAQGRMRSLKSRQCDSRARDPAWHPHRLGTRRP